MTPDPDLASLSPERLRGALRAARIRLRLLGPPVDGEPGDRRADRARLEARIDELERLVDEQGELPIDD